MQNKSVFLKLLVTAICVIFVFSCGTSSVTDSSENNQDTSIVVVRKPNIYIYPEKTIRLKVQLDFPYGGLILESIPEYGTGWDISVNPHGIIDDEYTYLYYECEMKDVYQRERGWVVGQENLESFFSSNLANYGFAVNEIDDFINYWIPRLSEEGNYIIYPQSTELIDKYIQLKISEVPNSKMRLFYLIEKSSLNIQQLEEPEIKRFTRNGMSVVEWGVILI